MQETLTPSLVEEYRRLTEENQRLYHLIAIQNQAIIDATHNLRNPLTSILLSIPLIEKYFSEHPLTNTPQQSVIRNLANITRITKHINDILAHLLEVQEIVNERTESMVSQTTNAQHINHAFSHMMEVHRLVKQHEERTNPPHRSYNEKIQISAEHRKPEPPVTMKMQVIEFATLVQLLVEEYRLRATLKNITIKYEERLTQDIWLLADKRVLTEIIENLLSNAIKYSYPNSAVLVKLVEENDKSNESVLRFIVEDTGKGMSPEEVQRVFEPQANISTRPTDGEQSHGIGLSITKRYADAMSFVLTCRSHQGAGTQFILEKREYYPLSGDKSTK